MLPLWSLPVTTVPRPGMVWTASTGKRNGLSSSRTGVGMKESTSFRSSVIASEPISGLLPSRAQSADPETMTHLDKDMLVGGISVVTDFSNYKTNYFA